jgi:hypothetical protein
MRFDGYLRKHLKSFDDDWMQRNGLRFSILASQLFTDIYKELRILEIEHRHDAEDMKRDIEYFALELQRSIRDPDWDLRYQFYIYLYVNIHALIEALGPDAMPIILNVEARTKCKEIRKIVPELTHPTT